MDTIDSTIFGIHTDYIAENAENAINIPSRVQTELNTACSGFQVDRKPLYMFEKAQTEV